MTGSSPSKHRWLALLGLALSIGFLIPGLFLPVIIIRGNLEPEGVATLAPQLLDQGVSEQTVNAIKPLLNAALVPLMEMQEGGLRKALVAKLGGEIGNQLKSGTPIEVYQQTRSILGSVKHLYEVRSNVAATLILLFSVIVPVGKATLVLWAVCHRDRALQRRTLHFVEVIAKWSMADVFAVALFIAYLAAQASQTPLGPEFPPAIVTFAAQFGPGFYWFTGYCLFSLGVQQATVRWIMAPEPTG